MLGTLAELLAKSICRHLSPEARTRVVRDSIPMKDLYSNLPRHQLAELAFGAANRTNISSLVINGDLGNFEGSPKDKAILFTYTTRRTWSPDFQTQLIDRIFAAGHGTFLDVGANIGLTAIPASKKHGIHCFAFEPDPTNFDFLRRNIERNGVTDCIEPINIALHDREASLDFELSEENLGDHRLRLPERTAAVAPAFGETSRSTVRVVAMPLDTALSGKDLPAPVFLKIDTQGCETNVLRGARKTLEKVDFLVVEFSPYHIARMGFPTSEYIEELRAWPFGLILSFDNKTLLHEEQYGQFLHTTTIIDTLTEIAKDKNPDNYVDVFLSRHKTWPPPPARIDSLKPRIEDRNERAPVSDE